MKHTLGPWRVNREIKKRFNADTGAPYNWTSIWIESSSGKKIALMYDDESPDSELVAAAPEMLVALKTIRTYYSDFMKHEMVPVAELRRLLDATIAKAEGSLCDDCDGVGEREYKTYMGDAPQSCSTCDGEGVLPTEGGAA